MKAAAPAPLARRAAVGNFGFFGSYAVAAGELSGSLGPKDVAEHAVRPVEEPVVRSGRQPATITATMAARATRVVRVGMEGVIAASVPIVVVAPATSGFPRFRRVVIDCSMPDAEVNGILLAL